MPKYAYPDNIVTAAMLEKLAKYGIDFSVRADESIFVSALDEQKKIRKKIFGGALLVSEKAAAEKAAAELAAAEKANAIVFKLSERELDIVKNLNNNGGTYQ